MVNEQNPWRRVSRRTVHENAWIRVVQDEVIRPDGQPGGYGVVQFQNRAVGVVAVDEHDRTLLVGQYRYPLDEYSWEIPEGGAPLGEDPLAAARRELREETGYEADEWRELVQADLSNSVTDERAVAYLATVLRAGDAAPEGTEQLELRWVPFRDALAMVRRGEIRDALSIIALQAVALERLGDGRWGDERSRWGDETGQRTEDRTMIQGDHRDERDDLVEPLPGVTPEEMGNAGFGSMGDAEPSTVLGGEIDAAVGLEGRTDLESEVARALDPGTPDRPGEGSGEEQRRQEAERRTP